MATSEALAASVGSPRNRHGREGPQAPSWVRPALWLFAFGAGATALLMTVAESGVEGVDATRALSVLVGWAFVGSGLYAWGRRPENRLGPLMTLVGYVYLTAQILTQAHAPLLFTSGIWIGDAWVVFFVLFLLSFPHGRLTSTFDLVVISMFALMALPLELPLAARLRSGRRQERAAGVAELDRCESRRLGPTRAGRARPRSSLP